jgi:hypothetical protein
MKNFLSLLFIILLIATTSWAQEPESTSKCHCFNDRVYDPDNKFIADDYLLTTSFNSFIAVNFNISKSQIVMMKMKGGVDPDALLIALYIAKEGNVQFDTILAVVQNGGTWEQVLNSGSIQGSPHAQEVFKTITDAKENQAKIVAIVTNEMLKNYFGMNDSEIKKLRKEEVAGRELVLVNILARNSKRVTSATEILTMYTRQQKSWSEIANYLGFTPKETGKLLSN